MMLSGQNRSQGRCGCVRISSGWFETLRPIGSSSVKETASRASRSIATIAGWWRNSPAWHFTRRRDLILERLIALTGVEGIITRTDRGVAQKEGLRSGEETTIGSIPDEPVEIVENGVAYHVDLRAGQKTGFYLDQRVNRAEVARYCRDKRVLDLFCFSGGFSLNAARNGAVATLGIDSSAAAIELARHHATLNRACDGRISDRRCARGPGAVAKRSEAV